MGIGAGDGSRRAAGRRLGRKDLDGNVLHRPGRDVTLSAPKSVSLMALVGGDGRIVAAHDRAVTRTLAWVERNAVETRVRDKETGALVRVGGQKMVAATFRHDLSPPHPRVEPEQEHVPVHRVSHRGLHPSPPARQHLGRRRYPLPSLAVVASSRRKPLLYRVPNTLVVHTRSPVHRTQERQALVGGHLSVALGQKPEAALHVPAGDGFQRAREAVSEIQRRIPPIAPLGARRPPVAGLDVVLARLSEPRQPPSLGSLARRVLPCGHAPEGWTRTRSPSACRPTRSRACLEVRERLRCVW